MIAKEKKYLIFFLVLIIIINVINFPIVTATTKATPKYKISGGKDPTNNIGEGNDKENPQGEEKCEPDRYDEKETKPSKTTFNQIYWEKSADWATYDIITSKEVNETIAGTRVSSNLHEYRLEMHECKIETITTYYKNNCKTMTTSIKIFGISIPITTVSCSKDKIKDCTSSTKCKKEVLEKKAIELVGKMTITPSYTVEIPDPNDANCTENNSNCKTYKITGEVDQGNYSIDTKNSIITIEKNVNYRMSGTCLNVKTAKVRYLKEDEKCNDAEEININSGEYWNLFVPLNLKSNEKYSIKLIPTSEEQMSGDECKIFIEKYKSNNEYLDYIIPTTGTFTGKINADKEIATNGCKFSSIIDINVKQKFYNETKDGKFDGFAFTYRPIDINNPFPNKINKNSYWEGWDGTSPNISESFSKITYATSDLTTTYDRYSLDTPYTDWQELMKPNGSNILIGDEKYENFIERIEEESYYKLGCGPANICKYLDKDQKKINPLYQEECSLNDSKIKAGDVCP